MVVRKEVRLVKKLLMIAAVFAILVLLTSCMGAPAGGGGVTIHGDPVAGQGIPAQAAANQPPAGGGVVVADEPAGGAGGMLTLLLPFVLMIGVMYLLVMRPQRRQAKATREMQSGLRVGASVVTTSGFYGKIVGVGTDSFLVEFGEGRGFKVWIRKSDIAGERSPDMTPPQKTGEETKENSDDKK